ncbi:MAG: winged helix-turn-helix transcriptional regulator, partial [Elusimicrobia bacterium]|nr:winged helix-turn-helix transcriptional regulator [Elusimicrobiota bacterium]MBD3412053.1 winged helix-turn-helix transcriptional regulator [Elusimicrobiota bacterium]
MAYEPILKYIKQINKPVFSTRQLASISGKSLSTTTQALGKLERNGIVQKIYRGIWTEVTTHHVSPFSVIPLLFPTGRVYVSLLSALHLYGIIEQIPQVIQLASTIHTKIIRTRLAVFSIHQISSRFFIGFDWYKDSADFLIAQPEKALADCLYISAYKGKKLRHFPELHFSRDFSFEKFNH